MCVSLCTACGQRWGLFPGYPVISRNIAHTMWNRESGTGVSRSRVEQDDWGGPERSPRRRFTDPVSAAPASSSSGEPIWYSAEPVEEPGRYDPPPRYDGPPRAARRRDDQPVWYGDGTPAPGWAEPTSSAGAFSTGAWDSLESRREWTSRQRRGGRTDTGSIPPVGRARPPALPVDGPVTGTARGTASPNGYRPSAPPSLDGVPLDGTAVLDGRQLRGAGPADRATGRATVRPVPRDGFGETSASGSRELPMVPRQSRHSVDWGITNHSVEWMDVPDVEGQRHFLATMGWTAAWYAVPYALYATWTLTFDSKPGMACAKPVNNACPPVRSAALHALLDGLPRVGMALAIALVVALLIRFGSGAWRPITAAFAAAIIGAGAATILYSVVS